MRAVVLLALLLAGSASAEPSVGARARVLGNPFEILGGGDVAAAYTWVDRWQLGVVGGAMFGNGERRWIAEVEFEFVVWLHPLSKLDLGLGMRTGYARVREQSAIGNVGVVEPALVFGIPLDHRARIVIEPIIVPIWLTIRPGFPGFGAS